MNREYFLDEAKKCVCGGREQDYGTPEYNFGLISELWTAYTGFEIAARDVAVMMAFLKIARIKKSDNEDSFVDGIGYLACAGEMATIENRKINCELY